MLMLAGLAAAFLAFVALLVGVVWYAGSPVFIGLTAASFGISGVACHRLGPVPCSPIRTSACFGGGRRGDRFDARAFTHVLVHERLPGKVLLVKRGPRSLKRHFKNMGPRQTMRGEWRITAG